MKKYLNKAKQSKASNTAKQAGTTVPASEPAAEPAVEPAAGLAAEPATGLATELSAYEVICDRCSC